MSTEDPNQLTPAQPAWTDPPPDPKLGPDDVHIWLLSLETNPDQLAQLRSLLAPEELAQSDRLVQPQHRSRDVIARASLRALLAQYLKITPQIVAFQFNAHGKPSLAPNHHSNLRFNLSHSHDFALIAFTLGREIGIDIEKIRAERPLEKLAERFFAPSEAGRLRAVPSAKRPRAFFECWTRKEAYIKARGLGLSLPLDSFEVAFGDEQTPSILSARDEPNAAARWSLLNLPAPDGFAAALVVESGARNLFCWRLSGNILRRDRVAAGPNLG